MQKETGSNYSTEIHVVDSLQALSDEIDNLTEMFNLLTAIVGSDFVTVVSPSVDSELAH